MSDQREFVSLGTKYMSLLKPPFDKKTNPLPKKWTLVVMEWEDAVTIGASNSKHEQETVVRRTAGFFIRRNRSGSITVAMEDDRKKKADEDMDTATTVPPQLVHWIETYRKDEAKS